MTFIRNYDQTGHNSLYITARSESASVQVDNQLFNEQHTFTVNAQTSVSLQLTAELRYTAENVTEDKVSERANRGERRGERERERDRERERERERVCCLTSTEASRPIRDGDEWEMEERRVKPRNRRQPGRPRPPWTAARTTEC